MEETLSFSCKGPFTRPSNSPTAVASAEGRVNHRVFPSDPALQPVQRGFADSLAGRPW